MPNDLQHVGCRDGKKAYTELDSALAWVVYAGYARSYKLGHNKIGLRSKSICWPKNPNFMKFF